MNDEDDASFTIRTPYFESIRVEETVELDGLPMTFRGWTHTLEDYSLALERCGFAVEMIREPRPVASSGRYQRWTRIPLFMNIRAVKR